MAFSRTLIGFFGLVLTGAASPWTALALTVQTPYPVVFVTQMPVPADFTTITSVFGNHRGDLSSAARGGDVWIRYGDGTLRNLTQAAGLSAAGMQGANAISVRDPSPNWDASKIVFSAVVGAPSKRYEVKNYVWQLYEMRGLGQGDTPVVTKVTNQPASFNNISPVYGSDDRIIFTSDRPRSGEMHLYPQLDEYEEAATVTGIWSLDPANGDLALLNHTPSGAFSPTIDSFGRVIFTRWDHLQRDQQADNDNAVDRTGNGYSYGTFNYSDESAAAQKLRDRTEVFPESRADTPTLSGLRFNQFFPWMLHQDGSAEETLNHIGRHELAGYGAQSFLDDGNLVYGFSATLTKARLLNDAMLQIREDPTQPGIFFGTSAPEFGTHAAGQIIKLNGAPGDNPDSMGVTYVTAAATASPSDEGSAAAPGHTGLYREPVPLSSGQLIAVHTSETRADKNTGDNASPGSRYAFRLMLLQADGSGVFSAGAALTPGISKSISFWDPDTLVSYNGPMWELNPVELKPRVRPSKTVHAALQVPEAQVFAEEGVDVQQFRDWLKSNDLAVAVSRNVTLRDKADKQQPYQLRVRGGVSAVPKTGKVYDVSHMQFFQGDQVRGIGGVDAPRAGRRVLAQLMHEPKATNAYTGVPGAVSIAPDGSMAALVPASRAMTWQMTNNQTPVVRERYWLSFAPGEVRVCASCHGINQKSQTGVTEPQNPPEALRQVLRQWKEGRTVSNDDRVFNWAEAKFPEQLLPKSPTSQLIQGLRYRFYSATNEYLGVKDGRVLYFKPGSMTTPADVGSLTQYLNPALGEGF
jgi:hypothetical protein